MQSATAKSAKRDGSSRKLPLQERLEAYIADNPGKAYQITTEEQAAELLIALAVTMKANVDTLAKPISPNGSQMVKNYNKKQRLYVRQHANKMKRAAANGVALEYCRDYLSATPLEYAGCEIHFD